MEDSCRPPARRVLCSLPCWGLLDPFAPFLTLLVMSLPGWPWPCMLTTKS